jgi:hypothetical protein
MKKKSKVILLSVLLAGLLGGAYALYLWNMPHLDVQAQKVDYTISATDLVSEYLANEKTANLKYLGENGESKIIVIHGKISKIDVDLNNQKVILLKDEAAKAGVSCSFMTTTNANTEQLEIGQSVSIKGIIRIGASYDADMEIYQNVVLEKCDVVK